jgi:hypothetical protein
MSEESTAVEEAAQGLAWCGEDGGCRMVPEAAGITKPFRPP